MLFIILLFYIQNRPEGTKVKSYYCIVKLQRE